MRGWHRTELTICLESPFLSASLETRPFGVDVGQLETNIDGENRPVLPAGLLRGVLAHALAFLKTSDVDVASAQALFGSGSEADEHAGAIGFSDAIGTVAADMDGMSTRIRIDDETGAVSKGGLIVTEICRPIGEIVCFKASARYFAESADAAHTILGQLNQAAHQVRAVGAFKSAGFGRVTSFTFAVATGPGLPALAKAAPNPGDHHRIEFTVDGHLMTDADQPASNMLVSRDVISGAALKGALAQKLLKSVGGSGGVIGGELGCALSKTRFSFASVKGAAAPMRLSLMELHQDGADAPEWVDAAADAKSYAYAGKTGTPPAFRPDWKSAGPKQNADSPRLTYETRTRLAVDEASGAAADGQLFSHRFIADPGRQGIRWTCTTTAPAEAQDLAAYAELIGHLEGGLPFLGRLKAAVTNVVATPLYRPAAAELLGDRIILTLTSPHWMLRAQDMADEKKFADAINKYFTNAGNGALAVASSPEGSPLIFASQEVRGRFQMARHTAFGKETLEPFVLMQPGSVFVLSVCDRAEASKRVHEWRLYGLPDPVINNQPPTFKDSPFLRTNGYGAVDIADDVEGPPT